MLYNVMQMLCNVMQCYAMLCSVRQCYANVRQCYAMLYNVMQCYTMLCNVVQCYVMLYNAMQCYARISLSRCGYVRPEHRVLWPPAAASLLLKPAGGCQRIPQL